MGAAWKEDPNILALFGRTDRSLRDLIEEALGRRPLLQLVRQRRISPPHARWIRKGLGRETVLLERISRYRLDDMILSRNIAVVDPASLDGRSASLLEEGLIPLSEIFRSHRVQKRDVEIGPVEPAPEIFSLLRSTMPGEGGTLPASVWRRYVGAIRDVPGFLVVEALPELLWRSLLSGGGGETR